MKITILRKMEYKGYYIYVRQFAWEFEYLVANNNGEIFNDRFTLKPGLKKRIISLLKFGHIYTKQQVEEGEEIILSGALATVDKFNELGFQAIRRKVHKKNLKKKCSWITRENNGDPIYLCLTHGKVVKMVDGEKPVHD